MPYKQVVVYQLSQEDYFLQFLLPSMIKKTYITRKVFTVFQQKPIYRIILVSSFFNHNIVMINPTQILFP